MAGTIGRGTIPPLFLPLAPGAMPGDFLSQYPKCAAIKGWADFRKSP